jgi:hypothetical protein
MNADADPLEERSGNPLRSLSTIHGDAVAAVRLTQATPAARWWSLAVVVILAAVLWILRLSGSIDLRYDAGVYYVLGTSLAAGDGYRITSEPGSPAAIQYPPGLPMIVALHQRALGTSDPAIVGPWLRKTYAVMFVAFAVSMLLLARSFVSPLWAVIATGLCLLQADTTLVSDLLFAELPLALVSMLLAVMLTRNWLKDRPVAREVLGFTLASLAFSLRVAGLVVLVAWALEPFKRRERRLAAIRAVFAAMPMMLWQAYVTHVRASEEYQHPVYAYQRAPYQFYNVTYGDNMSLNRPFRPELGRADRHAIIARVRENLGQLPLNIGEMVSESSGMWMAGYYASHLRSHFLKPTAAQIVVVAEVVTLAALAVGGLAVLVRRGAWFTVAFTVGSIALVIITPWTNQFRRYLMPVTPMLVIAAIVGAQQVRTRLNELRPASARVIGRAGLLWLLGTTFAVQAYGVSVIYHERKYLSASFDGTNRWNSPRWFYYDKSWVTWSAAVDWIKANAASDAVIATTSPQLCYLRTGRLSVFPPMEVNAVEAGRLLDSARVSYVIVDEFQFLDIARRYALPAVTGDHSPWHEVQRFHETRIFQRDSSSFDEGHRDGTLPSTAPAQLQLSTDRDHHASS